MEGAQCGYCTPGFMITVRGLLQQNPNPTEEQIRDALSSNLCRCTGYVQMYEAIRAALAAERRADTGELAARTAKPLTTSPLTPEYRREMIRVLTKRALLDLREAC